MFENGQKEDRLLDYLYGELSDKEAREVEAHLAQDHEAALELSRLREVRQKMAQLPPAVPRESVLEAIRKRAHQLAPQPQPRRNPLLAFILRPSFAGAFVFVLVLAVGLYVARYGGDPESRPDSSSVSRFAAPPPTTATPVAAAPAEAPEPKPGTATQAPAAKEKRDLDDGRRVDQTVARAEPRFRKLRRQRRRPMRRRAPRIVARVARPLPEALFPKKKAKPPARQRLAGRSADPAPVVASEDTGGGMGTIGLRGGASRGFGKDAERTKGRYSRVRLLANAYRPPEAKPRPGPAPSQPSMAQGYLPRKQVQRRPRNDEGLVAELRSRTSRGARNIAQAAAPPPPAPVPPPADVSAFGGSAGKSATRGLYNRQGLLEADKAIQAKKPMLAKTTTVNADAPRSLLEQARQELAQGKVHAAIATLNKLLRAKGKRASREVYRLLAQAYERRGDTRLAARTRERAAIQFAPSKAANKAKAKAKRSRPAVNAATKSY